MLVLTRQERTFLVALVAILCLGMGLVFLKRSLAVSITTIQEKEDSEKFKETSRGLLVLVKGAVRTPGIYRLPMGSRVVQAVRKAHPEPDADMMALGLAEFLKDGQTLIVPRVIQSQDGQSIQEVSSSEILTKVNINMAPEAELDQLPGIGPGLALRIITYRKAHRFASLEDLMKVPGIGQKRFEELKDRVRVE